MTFFFLQQKCEKKFRVGPKGQGRSCDQKQTHFFCLRPKKYFGFRLLVQKNQGWQARIEFLFIFIFVYFYFFTGLSVVVNQVLEARTYLIIGALFLMLPMLGLGDNKAPQNLDFRFNRHEVLVRFFLSQISVKFCRVSRGIGNQLFVFVRLVMQCHT